MMTDRHKGSLDSTLIAGQNHFPGLDVTSKWTFMLANYNKVGEET